LEGIVTGVVVGAIVAIVGAVGNYLASIKRDERQRSYEREIQRERWEREDRVQHERWEREDRVRYHEERLSAYRRTYHAVKPETFGFFRTDPMEDFIFAHDALEDGLRELSLLHAEVLLLAATKDVREASSKINMEAFLLSRKVQNIPHESTISREEGGQLLDDVLEAGAEFLWAAREELGIGGDPTA
jgi:hypothetical protein